MASKRRVVKTLVVEMESRYVVWVRTSREGTEGQTQQQIEQDIQAEQVADLMNVPGMMRVTHEGVGVGVVTA